MSTIHIHRTTTSTPEQYIAGLTDFGPGRSELFGNSADEYLKVHHKGISEADVTEGSGGIWERLHYDWSNPNRVILSTTDSNVWGGASGHTYNFTRRPDGRTEIDVTVVRDGKNFKGRALGAVLGTVGRHVLENAFDRSRRVRTHSTEARSQRPDLLQPVSVSCTKLDRTVLQQDQAISACRDPIRQARGKLFGVH
jgi:hypothetical protein